MRWPSRHRSKVQSRRFHDAMVGVYERVSAACPGYRLTAFLAMTRDRGGLTAARALLHPERGVSEGLGNERDVSQRSLAVRAVRLLYRGLKPKTASGPGFSSSSRALLMRCHGRKYVGVAVVRAAQLAPVLLIRDILYPQPQSRGGFTHDPPGNHPHLGGSGC